jgi:hypothetical protein
MSRRSAPVIPMKRTVFIVMGLWIVNNEYSLFSDFFNGYDVFCA